MIGKAAAVVLFFVTAAAHAQWERIGPGVDYRRFTTDKTDIHVARVDLDNPEVRVIASNENERGMTVSALAKGANALIAINGDYFDDDQNPIGLAVGSCGRWKGTKDTKREGVVAIGDARARIDAQRAVMEPPEPWVRAAVSGWPLIVRECAALRANELPGSDAFTRAPHPRTAVGLSKSGRILYLVVADGRRECVPGLTLAELAAFMSRELDVCSAMNLDGGGSSAMWVRTSIVNKPSDGVERRVANHLAVVLEADAPQCEAAVEPPLH